MFCAALGAMWKEFNRIVTYGWEDSDYVVRIKPNEVHLSFNGKGGHNRN